MINRKELITHFHENFPWQVKKLEEIIDYWLLVKVRNGNYDVAFNTKGSQNFSKAIVSFNVESHLSYSTADNTKIPFELTKKHFDEVIPKYQEDGYQIDYHKYGGNYNITVTFPID